VCHRVVLVRENDSSTHWICRVRAVYAVHFALRTLHSRVRRLYTSIAIYVYIPRVCDSHEAVFLVRGNHLPIGLFVRVLAFVKRFLVRFARIVYDRAIHSWEPFPIQRVRCVQSASRWAVRVVRVTSSSAAARWIFFLITGLVVILRHSDQLSNVGDTVILYCLH